MSENPREYFIDENEWPAIAYRSDYISLKALNLPETSHFIEYSAFKELKDERDALKFALSMKDDEYVQQVGYWKIQQRVHEELKSLSVKLQRTVNAAYHALLEMSAWMGIPEEKREKQIDYLMENIKFCAEHDLRHIDDSQEVSSLKQKLRKIGEINQQLLDGHDPEITIDTRQCLEMFDEIKLLCEGKKK